MNAAKEAERMAARIVGDPGIGAQARRAQYRMQAAALRQVHSQLWGDISDNVAQQLDDAMRLGIDAGETLQGILGGLGGFDDLLQASAQATESIVSRALNNIPLSRAVYNNRAWSQGKIDAIINNGLGAGKSAREIAAAVRSFISPNTPGGASYAAMRLGRTEINNAFHRTSTDRMKSEPWVEGIQWNLSGSHPRADICDEYAHADNGMGPGVYEPKDIPGKPHPQCLCYVTAVTPDRETFLENLSTGKYDSWMEQNGISDASMDNMKFGSGPDEPLLAPQAPSWKPRMSTEEADHWAVGSAIPGPRYHGTMSGGESIGVYGFDDTKIGAATGNYGMLGKGHYFTSDVNYARTYAGSGDVVEVRLRVMNPMPMDEFQQMVADEGLTFTKEGSLRVAELAQERGYDAIRLVPNPKFPDFDEIVVFDRRKIAVVDVRSAW